MTMISENVFNMFSINLKLETGLFFISLRKIVILTFIGNSSESLQGKIDERNIIFKHDDDGIYWNGKVDLNKKKHEEGCKL